ncbi:MAG: zf-HC2 domain-containing protein [Rhodocyclaceae bacterium]|nr:zf-HC2 domain-containing protein [Rhodocyclaceae bacterium]
MLSCKDTTHLLSAAQDRKLAWSERMSLEMHLVMCKGCTNFRKQMTFLRTACRRYTAGIQNEDPSRKV